MIAERVIDRMDQLGIKLTAAAEKLGLSHGFFYDLKNGRKKTVSAETIPALAELLQCDVQYLLGMQDEPNLQVADGEVDTIISGAINSDTWFFPGNDPWAGRRIAVRPDPRYPVKDQRVFIASLGCETLSLMEGALIWANIAMTDPNYGGYFVIEERRNDLVRRFLGRAKDGEPNRFLCSRGYEIAADDPSLNIVGKTTRTISIL